MIDGFHPVWWLRGRHLETIVPSLLLSGPVSPTPESRVVRVCPEAAVRIDIDRPGDRPRGTLVLVHGMGGSSESPYMRRTGRPALSRAWTVVRVNLRNCGGTERLSRTLYNAGQSDDIGCVLEELDREGFPRPFAAVGFSLGGNTLLRYAGTSGDSCLADAVVGVNPPVELETSLRALEAPGNALYHRLFLRRLCRQVETIRRHRPVPGPAASARRIGSLRAFDELFTAPDGGYASAGAYYAAASAAPRLGEIRRPCLVLSSANDPLVPVEMFERNRERSGERVRFVHPSRGGHLGYWQSGRPRFWAARAVLDFLDTRF